MKPFSEQSLKEKALAIGVRPDKAALFAELAAHFDGSDAEAWARRLREVGLTDEQAWYVLGMFASKPLPLQ